jgi:hypothetical protein
MDKRASDEDRHGSSKIPPVPSHQTTPPPLWSALRNSAYKLPYGAISRRHEGGGLSPRETLYKIWGLSTSFPRAGLNCPIEEIGLNIPSIWEDYCGTALRSWTQILNDEGALGTTARAFLHGAASKFRQWPLGLAFHSKKSGSPLCPSIAARIMATLLTADLHPIRGQEILSGNQISTILSTRIPIQTDKDGCPLDTQQFPQPTLILQKLVPLKGERIPQLVPNTRPSPRRSPLLP